MTKLTKLERDVIVYAIRYASKRRSEALSNCIEVLKYHIDSMEDRELRQLINESKRVVMVCNQMSLDGRSWYDLVIQDNLKLQAVCQQELERRV